MWITTKWVYFGLGVFHRGEKPNREILVGFAAFESKKGAVSPLLFHMVLGGVYREQMSLSMTP